MRSFREQRILDHPRQGEASEFYWFCRNGDVERVKELLKIIPFEDLNRLEPNGSTPLHAASYCGQVEIVRLLLQERNCRRDRLNRHGLTAYEEASSNEMRQLFHRPGKRNRFCDENDGEQQQDVLDMFEVTTKKDASTEEEEFLADQWLAAGHSNSEMIKSLKTSSGLHKCIQQSRSSRKFLEILAMEDFSDSKLKEALITTLTEHVSEEHSQYEKCISLISKSFEEHKPEYLLRLYTLKTPFYRKLGNDTRCLHLPLNMSLGKLEPRFFQGISYRGVRMTNEDLRIYYWSLKKDGAIRTRTFGSTSIDRVVAKRFSGAGSITADDKQSVLMIFNFPEHCDTAINLGKLSNELPCISEFENEAEVLLFPETFFMIAKIETTALGYIAIYLENVSTKTSFLPSFCKIITGDFVRFYKTMTNTSSK